VDEQENIILQVASGIIDKKTFTVWLKSHVVEINKV
jgi:prophage maintenance system killer protein